jgi:hypothetical protein
MRSHFRTQSSPSRLTPPKFLNLELLSIQQHIDMGRNASIKKYTEWLVSDIALEFREELGDRLMAANGSLCHDKLKPS